MNDKAEEKAQLKELGDLIQRCRESRSFSFYRFRERCINDNPAAEYSIETYRSWEEGKRRPSPLVLGVMARLLASTKEEEIVLAKRFSELAGYPQPEEYTDELLSRVKSVGETAGESAKDIRSLSMEERNRFEELKYLIKGLNPAGAEAMPNTGMGITANVLQKTVTPGLYTAIGGFITNYFLPKSDLIALIYLLIGIGLAIWFELSRARKRPKPAQSIAVSTGAFVAGYMFLALFVLLNSPLLVSAFTGMDYYGFFTFTNVTKMQAIMYATLVNLGIAGLATLLFYVLWQREFGGNGISAKVLSKSLKTVVPPMLVAYAIPAVLGYSEWTVVYFLILIASFAAGLVAMMNLSNPSVRLDQFIAKLMIGSGVGAMWLILIAGIVVYVLKIMGYFVPGIPTSFDSFVWARAFNPATLGYDPGTYATLYVAKHQAGFLWLVVFDALFLIAALCVPFTMTVYRNQYKIHGSVSEP
ncbi:MAG: hypothetical protein M1378_11640 [Bacteroidetes bacterium]|nr:hypothetical protein [Bacteroidota bacterium]